MASERTATASEEAVRTARSTSLRASGLTPRAVVLGVLAAAASAFFYPYAINVHEIHGMGFGYFPWFAVLLLFITVFVINVAFKLMNPAWALRHQEIAVVFVMALVAIVADVSLSSYFIATLATPRYYATPENEWIELLFDYVPDWIAPEDAGNAITWFFDGLPAGQSIPWSAWIVPLLWWGSFLAAFFLVCIALVALFRKQWVEHERLLFPLMNAPMALMEDSTSRRLLPAVTRKKSFIMGFLLIFSLLAWNVATHFNPALPVIQFGTTINLGRHFRGLLVAATPWVIGLCYFVNPEILFSFWFFQLLIRFQDAFFSRIGYAAGSPDPFESRNASMGWQTWGAFSVFVIYGMWSARHHLADVFRRAWRGLGMEHDERELMSPRLALGCLVAGLAYMATFMAQTGMSIPVIVLILPAAIIAYFGITRLVIEGGLPYVKAPITPQTFSMYTLGSVGMPAPTMVGIAFSYGWIVDMWCIFMPGAAHGAKLADWLGMNGRVIVIAVVLSLVVTLPLTLWYHIDLAYRTGAHNFTSWVYQGEQGIAFDYVTSKMRNPHGPDAQRLGFMGLGMGMTGLLIFIRHRFAWWPLHPIGLTCPVVMGTVGHFGAFFFTWLIKVILLKIGGHLLYERGKPFFIGLVVGHMAGSALYVLTDFIFFYGEGHALVRYL